MVHTIDRRAASRFESKPLEKMTANEFEAVASNIMTNAASLRRRIWDRVLDTRRDIDHECGYPATEALDIGHYRRMYDRNGIANRVVNLYPDECWKVTPTIFEDADPKTETQFEMDFDSLRRSMSGGSVFIGNEGHPIWDYCHRIDRLSGIGQFGIMLLGTDHPMESMEDPIEFSNKGKKSNELLYVRVFDEDQVTMGEKNQDASNPRFGMPEFYEIDFEEPSKLPSRDDNGIRSKNRSRTEKVHWSRVIHVAETMESSELFAVPRIRPNYNRLYDLRKVLSGCGEMYWRGALPPIFLESIPEFGTNVTMGSDSKDAFEQLMNTLQRWAFIPGVRVNQLAPTVVDPSNQVDVLLMAICIQLDCPLRIFVGSERGELASSQDSKKWNTSLGRRQNRYITPRLIVPLVDRLINIGVLSRPEQYGSVWPDMTTTTQKEQAEVSVLKTQSLVNFINGNGEAGMSLMDFYNLIMDMTEQEAEEIVSRLGEVERATPEPTGPSFFNQGEERDGE